MKKIEVKACWDCPYNTIRKYGVRYCEKEVGSISKDLDIKSSFPDWCPLPDDNYQKKGVKP